MSFLAVMILVVVASSVSFLITRRYMKKKQMMQWSQMRELLHDLKNPLTSILGYVELLELKERPREQQLEFLDIIKSESERLLQILCSSLSNGKCSSDDSGQFANCAKVVSLVCRGLTPDAEKKGITISYSCGTDIYVEFSETELWRIVTNLVENAIKYNKPGGSVKVSVVNDIDSVIVSCADTGIGIKSENISKVFNKGFRESQSLPGFGFGLSTVRNIVSKNGGSINLESDFGHGTKFTLKFRKAENRSNEPTTATQNSNAKAD